MIYLQVFWIWVSNWFGYLIQSPYSAGWDKTLNALMDSNADVLHDKCTVKIGQYEVWVANRWYAYAYPYNSNKPKVRPSIKTMIRFSRYIEEKAWDNK